jgi:uncharacterized protein (DUF1778 family)
VNKVRINFALTEEARNLLRQLADAQGISMTAMLEILIRKAEKERGK